MAGMKTKEPLPPTVWVLLAAAFVIAMGFGLIAPVLPLFAQDMARAAFPHAEITATTVVVSAFAVLRLLWATPAGSLVSRLGEKTVYITGVYIVAVSTALTAFSPNYWALLVFRSMGGVGSVMFTVAAMGLLIKIAPPRMRGRISAMYGAMFLIGNMTGPMLGGLLARFGVMVPFLIYAGALVVAGTLMAVKMPSTSPRRVGATPASAPMTLREAFADRAFVASLPGQFAHGWSNFGVRMSVVPLFIAFAVSGEAWVAGTAMAVFALGNAAVLPFASRFTDTVGRKPMIVAGLLVTAVFTTILGFTSGVLPVLLVCLLAGTGAGMVGPSMQAVIADVIGNERSGGKVVATSQMITDVGAILGPLLAGVLVDFSGYSVAFLATGIVLVLGAAPWLRTPDTIDRTRA